MVHDIGNSSVDVTESHFPRKIAIKAKINSYIEIRIRKHQVRLRTQIDSVSCFVVKSGTID